LLMLFVMASCSDDDSTGSKESTLPEVEIQTPWDGTTREGIVDVVIDASDNAGVAKVEFFANNTLVGFDTTKPYELEWDLTGYADGTVLQVYAKAIDINGNARNTTVLTVTKGESKAPVATLTSPAASYSVMQGYPTTFSGTATDVEDGALNDDSIIWSSNLQGTLSQGKTLVYRGLVLGTHVITMTAVDSDGNTDKKTVTISVTENDQKFAYIQEGTYKIGPPVFDEKIVIFNKPFIISKTELSLAEFYQGINLQNALLAQSGSGTNKTAKDIKSRIAAQTDNTSTMFLYPVGILSDTTKYGDYPAMFFTAHEFVVYCESMNTRDSYNASYKFYDNAGAATTSPAKIVKATLANHDDPSYVLNGWRLPTEAEWMVAASGGTARSFPWGEGLPTGKANTLADETPPNMQIIADGRGFVPVDSYKEYPSPYGLINMAGNAAELTSDIQLPSFPEGVDYVGYSEDKYVSFIAKGGAWFSTADQAKIGNRNLYLNYYGDPSKDKTTYSSGIGMRVARSLNVGANPW